MPTIPARKAAAFPVKAGQEVKLTNTFGKQALDFRVFNPNDEHDFLSMVHTRTVLRKIAISKGDKLYSTRRKPILTLIEDTTPGTHDLIWSACDAERYRMQGYQGYHDNCTDNMHRALKDNFPDFPIADGVPDPLNVFMNVPVDHRGGLEIRPPTSEAGQYVVLRAEKDLIVIISSCPQDIEVVNGGDGPQDCEYQIIDDDGT